MAQLMVMLQVNSDAIVRGFLITLAAAGGGYALLRVRRTYHFP